MKKNWLVFTWIIFLDLLNAMEASESMPDQNKEEGSQLNEVPPQSDEAVPPPTSDPKPSLVSYLENNLDQRLTTP